MSVRLLRFGHEVVAYDPSAEARDRVAGAGAKPAGSLDELVHSLEPSRLVWVMAPSGPPTQQTLEALGALMSESDTVIDGGNSNWRDSLRNARALAERGIFLLDCGTSGGVWGLQNGYCLMIGGDRAAFDTAEPVFKSLAPENGYAYVGPSGSGHFVKMVHNGIEYGMLSAYGEGFEILRRSPFELDLATIASIWRYGSVVRSWLLELLVDAFGKDADLAHVRGYVEDSGEGRWTVEAAIEESVPAPFTALSLFARFASRQDESYAAKVIAALRNEFGGHAYQTEESQEARPGGEL